MDLIRQFVDFFLHLDHHLGEIIRNYGTWTYGILFLIVFCETGLVILPLLPGDSLLFAAGTFAALGDLNPFLLAGLLMLAAILGDSVNYWIGSRIGTRAFSGEIRFLKQEYLDRTRAFYARHGGKTIILARFVPIVRTFAPFVAGVGEMDYPRFLSLQRGRRNRLGLALYRGGVLVRQHPGGQGALLAGDHGDHHRECAAHRDRDAQELESTPARQGMNSFSTVLTCCPLSYCRVHLIHVGRSVRLLFSIVLTPLVALVGCAAPVDAPQGTAFTTATAQAGQLARIRGEPAFIRCGGPPDTLWIADTPDHQVDSALAEFGDGPLPAVIRVDGGVVTTVRYVAPEGPDCAQLLRDGDLTAHGNEPFWHLGVTGDSAVVSTPEARTGPRFGDGRWARLADSGWRYEALGADGTDSLAVLLSERRCFDGMSGAWFPFAVRVSWGEHQLSGCALEGRGALQN